ncbi:MAG: IPT/TIG domain-containing protein [Bradymonadales bacterium]|nr:IPT/TIG domain-containing protein [Bradymonadales bacterium]
MRTRGWLAIFCLCVWGAGCGDDEVDQSDASDLVVDQHRPDLTGDADLDDLSGTARWTKPDGYASLTFTVDDSANQTYTDGQMEWNASLTYDADTNIVLFSSSWLPTQGPFPPLYDDGPYDLGGHEALGATAGDHVFSVEVFFLAEETTTFEYGLINELDYWIWVGPNGQVTVQQGEIGTVVADGMTFTSFGDIDLRVTLNIAELHASYADFDPANDALYVKGSMISWRPVQLLDNGERGDATADDGIFTMTLSEYEGDHDGLLNLEQEAQFVFVFYSAEGIEYKVGGNAVTDGVAAYSTWDPEQPGVFLPEELLLLPESAGRALNTAVLVGPDEQIQPTEDPVLRFIEPNRGPTTGGTPVELLGQRFAVGATVKFDQNAATCNVQSDLLITCTTPPHPTPGTVPVRVENPDSRSSTHELGFTYVDVASAPSITGIDPPRGSEMGGTQVTITGANFASGATVLFGENLAATVTFNSANALSATTPAGNPGTVSVTVRNPDSQTGTLTNGFTYEQEGVDWATIQWPLTTVTIFEGEPLPDLFGRVYEPGVTDGTGQGAGITAQLVIGPDGSNPEEEFSDDGWVSFPMDFHGDIGNDDEYVFQDDTLDPALDTVGEYDWAVRFSMDSGSTWLYADRDGSGNGYSVDQAGTIVVVDSSGLRVTDLSPPAISILGAQEIAVSGTNFSDGMTVQTRPNGTTTFAAQPYLFDSSSQLRLTFAAPTAGNYRAPDRFDLRLDDSDYELLLENAYLVGYLYTPTLDGTIENAAEDWPTPFRQAASDIPTNWAGNSLYNLYASFDEDGLYLGIEADLEHSGNTIVVYLDTDFGAASGFSQMNAIADEDPDKPTDWWRLDRAVTSWVDASAVTGFGADFAFGTMELAPGDVGHFINELTGWRKLVAGDNWWFDIESPCTHTSSTCVEGSYGADGQPGVIETFVPWTILYGSAGVPQGGRQIALFARIVNQTGDFLSNQSLPPEPSYSDETKWQVSEVLVFEVR